jgi:hypothetical protein
MLYEFKTIGGQVDKNNVWLKLAYLAPRRLGSTKLPESLRSSEFRTMDSSPARLTAEFADTRTRIRCSPLVLGINSPRRSIVKRDAELCRCSTTQHRCWNFLADVCRRKNLLNALYSFEDRPAAMGGLDKVLQPRN